jgi:DNA-binding MarR family transcriptional regulator
VASPASERKPVQRPATPVRRPAGRGRHPLPARATRQVSLDGLNDHLGYLVRRAQIWIFQDFIRTLAPVDIRPGQYSALTVIKANPGLSQMALAQALGIERARVVHLIDALEARRLVKRQSSRHDRRSHALHLTAEGQRAMVRIRDLALQHEKRVTDLVGAGNHKMLLRLFSVFAGS